MAMRLLAVLGLLAALALPTAPATATTSPTAGLEVTVDHSTISTQLGHRFEFSSTVRNPGPRVEGLVAHLNVLSLRAKPYVDPEDWSPQRVVFLDPIPAGGSVTLRWPMTAVNSGTFGVYVTVLDRNPGTAPAPNSPTVVVHVTERRTVNPGGILPLSIAVPTLLGAVVVWLRLRRRD